MGNRRGLREVGGEGAQGGKHVHHSPVCMAVEGGDTHALEGDGGRGGERLVGVEQRN